MSATPICSNNRILIVDDNPAIHEDIRKILASAEIGSRSLEEAKAAVFGESALAFQPVRFRIDSAFQGAEGRDKVQRALEEGQPYALAFVDMRMPPGWDGVTALTHLWKIDPELQVVICTAYSDYPWEQMVEKLGVSPNMVILKKPFDNIEVLQLAHALTEKWRLNRQVRAELANLDGLVAQRTAELAKSNKRLLQEIAERTAIEQTLRQAQKMEAVGQLAAGVAHDFNNILTVILGHVSLASEADLTPDLRNSVTEIRASAERATSLVRQLLTFSRKQVMQPAPVDLGSSITNLGEVLRRVLGEHVALEVKVGANLPLVDADTRMIEQTVINLAVNARDAMPKGGSLIIAAHEVQLDDETARRNPESRPGHFVRLQVSDTGCGIPPEVLPRIFEPFFTTKETGKGTGLGLASVYGIVKQHAGWIEVTSRVGEGTSFRLYFPACLDTFKFEEPPSDDGPLTGHGETILVVEDETAVRELTVQVLRRYGYVVLEAPSGVDALGVFEDCGGQIDLLLTDMVMPGGLSGRDLDLQLREQKPSLKVIYMTGYSQNILGMDLGATGEINLLSKPFSATELLRRIRKHLVEAPSSKPHEDSGG